jgi:formyl-CoA transferase
VGATSDGPRAGALAGYRILELAHFIAGPVAGLYLADMGADVIKVEEPGAGDASRRMYDAATVPGGDSSVFLATNRNERSVAVDLSRPEGRALFLRLVEQADVVIEAYRGGVAERLGIGYDACAAVNPRIVYCATYGFRAAGPYGARPAYDDVIQAASGLASLQASIMGEPRYVPTIVADKTSSMTLLAHVLAALYHQARTGEGQEVEVPMFESLAAWVMVEHLYGETFVPANDTPGYKRILNRYRRPFKTKDGYLAILPYSDQNWRDFFTLAGRQDLLDDPRFKTFATRLRHIEVLYGELNAIAPSRTNAEWLADLDRLNIPAMIVNSLETLLHDPQLEATGFWQVVEHPTEGTMRLPGIPATYGKTPGAIRRLPPRLGEHSLEILREAGLAQAEIDALLASGATRTGRAT